MRKAPPALLLVYLVLAAATLLALASQLAGGAAVVEVGELDDDPLGLGKLYQLLEERGAEVRVESLWSAKAVGEVGHSVDIVIVVPMGSHYRYPYNLELVAEGVSGLLIADELGSFNEVLNTTLGAWVSGIMLEQANQTPPTMVEVSCEFEEGVFHTAKVSWVEGRVEKVHCTSQGRPVVVEYKVNGTTVLLVADTTMFTNALIAGWAGMRPTGDLVDDLIGKLGVTRGSKVLLVTDQVQARERVEANPLGELLNQLGLASRGVGKEAGVRGWLLLALASILIPTVLVRFAH